MTAGTPFEGVPRSDVGGAVWPAVPRPGAARCLALLQQFEQTQWWTPESLRGWQLRQASALLEHAAKTVPFYDTRLRKAGIAPGARMTPEAWARIPLLSRADIQDAGADLHSRALPRAHGAVRKIASSGSTGRPIESLTTGLTRLFWNALTLRDHLWHRRDFSAKLASIRAFPTGTASYPRGVHAAKWGGAVAGVYPSGPSAGLSVVTPIAQQAEWLARENPDYLLIFPTALRALARHCQEAGIALPRLREVRSVSEILTPETRRACREAFGVGVVDVYSANEVGYMALQCPDREHYHVQSEGVLLEILKDDGTSCAPGETGRVVVTGLHNFAMPLIRYELGDLAELGGPCPCGRGLPVIKRILGRVRNMLRLPDGRQVWPLIGEPSYVQIPAIRQYQIVQTSLERLEIRLVTSSPLSEAEQARLRQIVLERLGHPFEIALSYHDQIPRSAGGKFEDFKCEIEEA